MLSLDYQVLLYPLLQFVNLNLDSHQMFQNQEAFLKADVLTHMLSLHLAGDLSLTEILKSNCLIQYHPEFNSLKNSFPELFINIDLNTCPHIYSHSFYEHFANLIGDSSLSLLLNHDFTGIPPTLLIIPEYDILRDEAIMFGNFLNRSGIFVEKYIAKGMFHGFMVLLNEYKVYDGGVIAYQEMAKAIKKQFLILND